jgi:lysophospholipase L1-like esterase
MVNLRRIRGLTLALVASLVLLEGVLQGLAYVVWLRPSPGVPMPASGGQVVLCVGDSFTQGNGARSDLGTYPAQLQAQLQERDPARSWRVANLGVAGQDSWDVLRRLDRQLADHQPRWVCVVVGINDRWSNPPLHELPATARLAREGFRLELRTLRLMKLLANFVRPVDTGVPESKPQVVELAATRPAIELAWAALGEQRCEDAALHFERAIADGHQEDWAARAWLSTAYVRTGQKAKAEQQLEIVARGHAEKPSRWTAESWVHVLQSVGRNDEALRVASRLTTDFPDSFELQAAIGEMESLIGNRDAARVALGRAIELSAKESPGVRAWRYWQRARIFACFDPELAIGDLLASHVLDPALRDRTMSIFRLGKEVFTPEAFRRKLQEVAPPAPLRAELVEMYLQVVPAARAALADLTGASPPADSRPGATTAAADPAQAATPDPGKAVPTAPSSPGKDHDRERERAIAGHLRQIVLRARGEGAEVVIGSYPVDYPFENGIMRRAAAELGCGTVDVWAAMREALETRARRELYSSDDAHCNDEGYGLMARAMANEILRLASSR